MGRAKDDLAELVAFRSVADPKQYPPEECEKAAQWVVDAFTEVGPAGRHGVADAGRQQGGARPRRRARRARRRCCSTATTTSSRRSARTRGTSPVWELTERDGRWYGRGAADCKGNIVMHLTALRALKQVARRLPVQRSSSSARAPRSRAPAASRRSCRENADLLRADTILVVDTGNFAVGVPTLTTTLRGMTSVDVTLRALGSAMHSGMFGGPAPDPVVGLIQMLASLHDERRQHDRRRPRRDPDVERASSTRPSSSAATPPCSTA